MTEADVVCFQCRQRLADPPVVQMLPDGEECPACRARLLELLPPLLPAARRASAAPSPAPEGPLSEA